MMHASEPSSSSVDGVAGGHDQKNDHHHYDYFHDRIVPTASEEETQGRKVLHGDLSGLPRSVRWRIQLGLLQEPPSSVISLEEVTECNRLLVDQQNDRFKKMVEQHLEEEEPTEDANNSEKQAVASDISPETDVNQMLDPLTAMVMEQEAQETRKAELYLKYRKERARMKRGLAVEARVMEGDSDEVDRASVRPAQQY
jgi:hypothetical protein